MVAQGEVYWVDVDSPSGSAPGYRRPYVVIQNNIFNQSRIESVVVCALTTNLRLGRTGGNISLQAGEANLPKASIANVSQILTLDKADLVEKIGTLSPRRVRQILQGVWGVLEPSEINDKNGVLD